MNHYWAKAARISLLLDSLICKESISICYEGTLPWQFFCSPLPETPSRAGRRHNNMHKKEVHVIALEAASSEMKWLAWNYIGSHELNWALKPAFPHQSWKTLANKHPAFQGSVPLLSFTECWALWCLAQHKCLRSCYSNVCSPKMRQFAKRLSSMHPNRQNSTLKALPSEEMFRLKEVRCAD